MAKNRLDYSEQLSDIGAPASADGSLAIRAGQLEGGAAAARGHAAATDIAANTGLLTFAGNTGIAAVKGKMEADEEKEISGVLRNLETVADADIDRNNQKLAGQFLDSSASPDFMGAETVKHFTDEARKYAEARRQGVIGREEAVAQIGSIIKKYSAMMPGWASDFRKIGAQLTGISNIDVYGIHQALTTKSAREKAAEKVQELNLQLKKEAASALGLTSLDQLSPTAERFYAETKQLGLITTKAENLKKQGDIRADEVDGVNNQVVSGYIASAVSGVATEFAQLHGAHMNSNTPVKHEEALRLGGQLAAKLDVVEAQVIAKINELTTGKNPMSPKAANERISAFRDTMKTWKEAVKTSEGFNLWTQQVKSAKGNVQFLLDSTMLATPHLAVLKELGVLPELTKSWLTLGDGKAFELRFGAEARQAMEAAMRSPGAYANGFRLIATGQTSIGAEIQRDPQMGRVLYNEVVSSVEQLVKNGFTDEKQKLPFSHMLAAYANQLDVSKPAELKKFQQLVVSENMTKVLGQLSPEQRVNAIGPILHKIERTVPDNIAEIRKHVDAYNKMDVNQSMGHKLEVVVDPVTQTLRLDIKEGKGTVDRSKFPKGAYGADVARMAQIMGPRRDANQREAIDAIQRELKWVNTIPHVVDSMLPLVNSGTKLSKDTILAKLELGIKGEHVGALLEGTIKEAAQAVAPRNQPSGSTQTAASRFDDKVIDAAIVAAERSNVNAGLSPKGALGRHQLMPETAKELGLRVDAEVDERTDPAKSGPAAIKYVRQHLAEFQGDVEKAAAAYNAGAGNVKKAVEKATAAGSPEDWVYYLPKPSETGPYIKRFVKALVPGQ
jgi:hypothetical protein